MKVKAFDSAAGIELRPKTGSFRAWRHLAAEENTKMEIPLDTLCTFCNGWLSDRNLRGYGEVWCICQVLKFGERYRLAHGQFASPMRDYKLSDLQIWGDDDFQDDLQITLMNMEEWLKWPEEWLVIEGTIGVGKTHILQSLAHVLKPWSLYITASDFESKLFFGMDKSSDYKVEQFIYTVSHAPFLFLDDLGTEYGAKFPKAALRRVIDYRYSRPSEYVTVVATNLRIRQLIRYDERVADRLLDKHIGSLIQLRNKESWRRHGEDTT
jgi:DNA replication protein DnaC